MLFLNGLPAGVIECKSPKVKDAIPEAIDQRAASPATVKNYRPVVRAFLDERVSSREIDLASLSAWDANQFVRREAERLRRSRAKLVVTALCSFLRHLHQRGDLQADLASAVLPVKRWRLSGLPKSLAPEQVMAILASCDRETLSGPRNYAILLLLARLGLRAGEVTALTLDDFDWHEGIVTVPGKEQRREPLPLPHEFGEALAIWRLRRDGKLPKPKKLGNRSVTLEDDVDKAMELLVGA